MTGLAESKMAFTLEDLIDISLSAFGALTFSINRSVGAVYGFITGIKTAHRHELKHTRRTLLSPRSYLEQRLSGQSL